MTNGRELDPRVQRLVSADPSLASIAKLAALMDEREVLIQMVIQLARDKDRLSRDLVSLSDHQPATLPMGRNGR